MIKFKYWNLLKRIRGAAPFPYSRWLSTPMEQKMGATAYTIFVALCFLTLGIFILNYHLLGWCVSVLTNGKIDEEDSGMLEKFLAGVYVLPFLLIQAAGEVIIGSLTWALTMASCAIVGLIHLASMAVRNFKFNKDIVQNLPVQDSDIWNGSSYTTIGAFLKENKKINFFKDGEPTVWISQDELHINFPKFGRDLFIELKKDSEKAVDELAQTDIKILSALNRIGYYDRRAKQHGA